MLPTRIYCPSPLQGFRNCRIIISSKQKKGDLSMLDIKEIRKDPELIQKKIKTKDPSADLSPILELDSQVRTLKTEVDERKSKKNHISKEFGLKKRNKEDTSQLSIDLEKLDAQIRAQDDQIFELENELHQALSLLPNLPFDEIPIASGPEDNVCIKTVGAKAKFSFPFKNHVELNEKLHLFDFARGAKIGGSGWPLYKGMGARLEWALINYMLDIHRKNGFTQVIPPLVAKPEVLYGVGQLPKFEGQQYKVEEEDHSLYLIPTAEAPLCGMHMDELIEEDSLPFLYTAYTPCFRREAGAAGAQERGLIRTHQFNKVELFSVTKPEESLEVYEKMLASAEEVLQGLELHYRNMLLTTGDMSFQGAKTIDIEVWLPGQSRYMEVSSVSHCTDFQARRASIRFRKNNEKPQFVHTLNGSGLATSRLMVSILENNQQKNGSILVPKVLYPYLGEEITAIGPTK